ncbi:hypothetical protein LR48_Vigan02g196600 [Vigna angularis]|uniref:Uncharacterized protein n=2 Tax=Phaseolus angularis TaxID=3914 RepID=A0A0L9TZ78_PHAAN|nr:uncharacterized protein HKW66_Vig0192510 [Vigna angularis]KOM35816.1 hypothetical protein LR48_Vigan02g196600 [Vigna angularis]BAT94379.1 hypothetical protein VIGAN_08097800 [Vigna angularis var. angularis]
MEEEEERTATFYVYHPCYFLQQALRAFFKCLGIERTLSPQTHAAADPTINSSTNTQTSLDAADPSSVTDINVGLFARRDGSRRSPITHGPGPQHN